MIGVFWQYLTNRGLMTALSECGPTRFMEQHNPTEANLCKRRIDSRSEIAALRQRARTN